MTHKPYLSLDDFKKWMEQQEAETPFQSEHDRKKHDLIGVQVESKVGAKKLVAKMTPEDGEAEDLALDFLEFGGVISDTEGKNFLIEVDSGYFRIARHYVRRS